MKNALIKLLEVGRAEDGQAMTEYAITVAAILGVIALASSDALPLFPALIEAFQIYLDSMHTVVTLPIP